MSNFINYKHQDVIDLLAPIYDEWGQIEPTTEDMMQDGTIREWLWSHLSRKACIKIYSNLAFNDDQLNILFSDEVIRDSELTKYVEELMFEYTRDEHFVMRHFNPVETDADNAFKRGE